MPYCHNGTGSEFQDCLSSCHITSPFYSQSQTHVDQKSNQVTFVIVKFKPQSNADKGNINAMKNLLPTFHLIEFLQNFVFDQYCTYKYVVLHSGLAMAGHTWPHSTNSSTLRCYLSLLIICIRKI